MTATIRDKRVVCKERRKGMALTLLENFLDKVLSPLGCR